MELELRVTQTHFEVWSEGAMLAYSRTLEGVLVTAQDMLNRVVTMPLKVKD